VKKANLLTIVTITSIPDFYGCIFSGSFTAKAPEHYWTGPKGEASRLTTIHVYPFSQTNSFLVGGFNPLEKY